MLMSYIDKEIPIRELVLQDALVFLVETYLKPVLSYSSKMSYYKVDFCNVCVELYEISIKVKMILEQEIIELIELIKLSTAKSVRDMDFSFSFELLLGLEV